MREKAKELSKKIQAEDGVKKMIDLINETSKSKPQWKDNNAENLEIFWKPPKKGKHDPECFWKMFELHIEEELWEEAIAFGKMALDAGGIPTALMAGNLVEALLKLNPEKKKSIMELAAKEEHDLESLEMLKEFVEDAASS